jgi:tRNA A-37 threonylcarbamoyl transferase component Bud32
MSESKMQPPLDGMSPLAASRIVASLRESDDGEGSGSHEGPESLLAIAGYRLVRPLGQGGSGTVYLAYRHGSECPVALKVLKRPQAGMDEASRRAWREIEFLSRLHLPAVPRVIDYAHAGGQLLIATEYVDGLPLSEYSGEAVPPLDRRARVHLLARIADAVHSLHEHGVMHRDIKPSNILIDRHGDPVIIDLGIAALLADDPLRTLTSDGTPIGSPAFMAPEQARGDRMMMSTRTDVYGLGATGCWLLTGQTPFDTDTTLHTALHRIANEDARHPLDLEPDLPRPLAAVLAKATCRNPEDRYESAAAFAADLRRWLAGDPVFAVPPGLLRRAARWAARRPVLTTAVACAAVGSTIVAASSLLTSWWLNERPDRIDRASDGAHASLRTASNREVRKWGTGEPGSIQIAAIVQRPPSLGGGRVLLISAYGSPEVGGTNAQLAAYSLGRTPEVLWTAPATAPGIQMPENTIWADDFHTILCFTADIFPDAAGQELVVVHGQGRSPHALRVYDLAGDVLFEVWHLGRIGTVEWLESEGLLIASADQHAREWDEWVEMGFVLAEPSAWPRVLFAIRPERGRRYNEGWINGHGQYPRASVDLRWYRYVVPREQTPTYVVLAPSRSMLHRQCVEVEIGFGPPSEGVSFRRLLNAAGEFIQGTEVIGDSYRRTQLATRPTDVYRLVDAAEVCGMELR